MQKKQKYIHEIVQTKRYNVRCEKESNVSSCVLCCNNKIKIIYVFKNQSLLHLDIRRCKKVFKVVIHIFKSSL